MVRVPAARPQLVPVSNHSLVHLARETDAIAMIIRCDVAHGANTAQAMQIFNQQCPRPLPSRTDTSRSAPCPAAHHHDIVLSNHRNPIRRFRQSTLAHTVVELQRDLTDRSRLRIPDSRTGDADTLQLRQPGCQFSGSAAHAFTHGHLIHRPQKCRRRFPRNIRATSKHKYPFTCRWLQGLQRQVLRARPRTIEALAASELVRRDFE